MFRNLKIRTKWLYPTKRHRRFPCVDVCCWLFYCRPKLPKSLAWNKVRIKRMHCKESNYIKKLTTVCISFSPPLQNFPCRSVIANIGISQC